MVANSWDVWMLKQLNRHMKNYERFMDEHPSCSHAWEDFRTAVDAMTLTTIFVNNDFYNKYEWFFNAWRNRVYKL